MVATKSSAQPQLVAVAAPPGQQNQSWSTVTNIAAIHQQHQQTQLNQMMPLVSIGNTNKSTINTTCANNGKLIVKFKKVAMFTINQVHAQSISSRFHFVYLVFFRQVYIREIRFFFLICVFFASHFHLSISCLLSRFPSDDECCLFVRHVLLLVHFVDSRWQWLICEPTTTAAAATNTRSAAEPFSTVSLLFLIIDDLKSE